MSGGQGVYTRHLSKALVDLGHTVEVLGGQPYPGSTSGSRSSSCPSLDIYNEHFPMRMPWIGELKHFADFVEVTSFSLGTFPEPLAFSVRAWQHLRTRRASSTSSTTTSPSGYGLLAIERDGPARRRHHPPPHHRRPTAGDGARRERLAALEQGPLVRLHQDADPGGQPHEAGHHRVGELPGRHPQGPPGPAREHGHRPRRRGPGAVPAAPPRRAGARPAHHHRRRPTWP